eukprot:7540-Heterococcus_DN1.PRE.2
MQWSLAYCLLSQAAAATRIRISNLVGFTTHRDTKSKSDQLESAVLLSERFCKESSAATPRML